MNFLISLIKVQIFFDLNELQLQSNINKLAMGNLCCRQPIKLDAQELPGDHISRLTITEGVKDRRSPPNLDVVIQKMLEQKKPFEKELLLNQKNFQFKAYKDHEVFHGLLDENRKPSGIGKLYKKDGSLVIGYFKNGLLNGPAVFITKNQLFCEGDVDNGQLNCQKGCIQLPNFKYVGSLKNNLFDGDGIQTTEESKFEGTYRMGKRLKGKITWLTGSFVYQYEGSFDQEQKISGNGKLIEPFGTYEGFFKKGQKHGAGKYTYNSGLIYQGDYVEGKRQGSGKIINKDGKLSYQGEFKNGLPHGVGQSYKNGEVVQRGKFIDGIFEQSL